MTAEASSRFYDAVLPASRPPLAMHALIALLLALTTFAIEDLPSPDAKGRDQVGAIEVQARAGRTLKGVVDDRTDGDRLWLRREEGGIIMAVSVAWDEIDTAAIEGEAVSVDELAKRSARIATAEAAWYAEVVQQERPYHTLVAPGSIHISDRGARRVRSVQIVAACLANFDRDVEPDGLQIALAALDEHGIPVAVRGNFSAQLAGERRPARAPHRTFGVLERWSESVRPTDFIDGVATYELPFRRAAPEWEFELTPDALVNVTLGVYGEGNFAASAPVVLREINPLRDHLQLERGTRFVPNEVHRPHPHILPRWRDGQWLYWTL
jgi:hypothetical protein